MAPATARPDPAVAGRAASPTDVEVSIVLVNKGDPRIARTLEALTTITSPERREVVVVDASRHALDDVRDAFASVTWVDYENTTAKSRTIAEQRNVGIASSSGGVVVFLDANCLPAERWLERLTAPVLDGSEAIVVGRITSPSGVSVHDAASAQGGPAATYLEECANMNVAFRRDVLEQLGGFDERLGFAEDVDFAWRARDAGHRIRYEPAAVIEHDWGGVGEELLRAFRYGVARVRLYRKHASRRRNLLTGDRYVAGYALYLALSPIALFFPTYLLALAYPLWRHRRHRPLFAVAYQLTYAAGVVSEVCHVPTFRRRATRAST